MKITATVFMALALLGCKTVPCASVDALRDSTYAVTVELDTYREQDPRLDPQERATLLRETRLLREAFDAIEAQCNE